MKLILYILLFLSVNTYGQYYGSNSCINKNYIPYIAEPTYETIDGYLVKQLFLEFGQSNLGRDIRSSFSASQEAQYGGLVDKAYIINEGYTYRPSQLNVGVNTHLYDYNNLDELGFECSWMPLEVNYDKKEKLLIKVGKGSTTLCSHWLPGVNGSLYDIHLMPKLLATLQIGKSRGVLYKIIAVVLMQGEQDGIDSACAYNYYANINTLFDTFHSDLSEWYTSNDFDIELDYKIIIGRILDNDAYSSVVITAEENFVSDSTEQRRIIPTDSYDLIDGVHYSVTGQIEFGQDIFNSYR